MVFIVGEFCVETFVGTVLRCFRKWKLLPFRMLLLLVHMTMQGELVRQDVVL